MPAALNYRLLVLLTFFVSAISILNVLSAKLWAFPIFGVEFAFSAGIVAYWITFAVTDSIAETYGTKLANFTVWMGFVANLVVLSLSQMALHLPPARDLFAGQESFEVVLGAAPRIVVASLCAYLIAQLHDVWAFEWWKRKTGGRHLWLRNNLSTFGSQLIDSIIFNGLAFYLLAPEPIPLAALAKATVAYWLFKVFIALFDTPVVYLLCWWLKKGEPQK